MQPSTIRPRLPGGRLIVALDTADLSKARAWANAVGPHSGMLKVGLELFVAHGAAIVAMTGRTAPIFLDLKLHDIPNTVAGAVRAALPLQPRLLTLHAAGGAAMIGAAREAAELSAAARPLVLAVTVLTSLDQPALAATGVAGGVRDQVIRLARLAMAAGADGLVCSPAEVVDLRRDLGPAPLLVVPGIRPSGSAWGDQARVMTPAEAVRAGADWIVVGRPITEAPDPAAAAAAIAAEIAAADAHDGRSENLRHQQPRGLRRRRRGGRGLARFRVLPPLPAHRHAGRGRRALGRRSPGGPRRVGLFVEPTEDTIAMSLATVKLDVLQLYATADRAAAMRARFGVPVWRAVGVRTKADLPADAAGIDGLLLEAKAPPAAANPGGNAQAFDWSVPCGWRAPVPWLLAGGLTPDNVADAICASGAPAVDVSSGVERSRGVKDPAKVAAFVSAARGAGEKAKAATGVQRTATTRSE